MSAILASILVDVAAKVGAPIVKSILQKHVGGTAGELGGVVIDAIAERAGVPAEDLQNVPPADLGKAVAAVEAETPELVTAWTESQREANRLMLAEMQKEAPFGWMWRPAGMWLMLVCIAWYAIVRPLLNAALWALGTATQIDPGIEIGNFLGIFTIYTGLYMGGNTAKSIFAKGAGK
jgi:hypothetical protein